MLWLYGTGLASAQGRGGATQPPPTETVTPEIAGVVAAGTKVIPIKDNMQNTQGAIAAPDGSLLFTERVLNRITRLDPAGTLFDLSGEYERHQQFHDRSDGPFNRACGTHAATTGGARADAAGARG